MQVYIKNLNVEMEVKTKGIEFQVRDNQNKLLGDCYLTKTGLVWCKGRTKFANGKKIKWEKFIEMMEKS